MKVPACNSKFLSKQKPCNFSVLQVARVSLYIPPLTGLGGFCQKQVSSIYLVISVTFHGSHKPEKLQQVQFVF